MRIIINADDFGISEEVNKTVQYLHDLGIVSSASIMAQSRSFQDAIRISRIRPELGIGIHLCLDGPYNVGNKYRSIADPETGLFLGLNDLINRFRRNQVYDSEVYLEYCLQIEKVLSEGVKVSHLDHHHHLHLYPVALRSMIKAARRYDIKYIRSCNSLIFDHRNLISPLYRKVHQFFVSRLIGTTEGFFLPQIKTEDSIKKEISRLEKLFASGKDVVEIVAHPMSVDDAETSFFNSDVGMKLLNKVKIINYWEI